MNMLMTSHRSLAGRALMAFVLSIAMLAITQSAEPTFVGRLSLAVESDVADQLQLSPKQREELNRLIDRRESEALEMAISARRLDAATRRQKLADFVAESERQGFALLTADQLAKLKRAQFKQEGLSSLADPQVASALKLTDQQQQQVQQMLQQRRQDLAQADERRESIVRADYERRLAKLLTESQRVGWGRLTSLDADLTMPAGATDAPANGDRVAQAAAPHADDQAKNNRGESDGDGEGLKFNFRYAPWSDVLDWFAEQADLSMVLDAPPPGTFNYTDNRTYTPAEAIDLINSVLLTKGYTLVRRQRMLLLINLEDGIPPNLVTTVPARELDDRGEFELVSCLFPLERISPEDANEEIEPLIGPQGDVKVLSKAKQLLVTETAGRLRTIRDILQAIEDPNDLRSRQVTMVQLKHITPDEAFSVIRQMMGLPDELNSAPDGSFRMTTDPLGGRLMLKGKPDAIEEVTEIVKLVDVPASGRGILGTPQLEVYSVQSADPESVLEVVQTLLEDQPDVRLATDPKTGNLVAMGLPSHHATIRATLDQMERDGQSIEVLKLRYVDPQLAVLSINRLFGAGEEGARAAPRVDADIASGQLMLRGTKAQIDQVRILMQKMGELGGDEYDERQRTRNVRLLPFSGAESATILQKAGEIWPTMRKNRIRTVVPTDAIRSIAPGAEPDPVESTEPTAPDGPPRKRSIQIPGPIRSSRADNKSDAALDIAQSEAEAIDQAAVSLLNVSPLTQLLALRPQSQVPAETRVGERSEGAGQAEAPGASDGIGAVQSVPGAEIVVATGPNGLMIASQDIDALNDFEDLLLSLAERENSGSEFAVFYLRHATAESAASVLIEVLGGSDSSAGGASPAGGGLLGSLAGAALGDAGGGLVGSLLGLGGEGGAVTYTSSGSFKIVSEPRLNFLIVQANPEDMQLIEAMLEVIDQRKSTVVVETIPAPRLIPVIHTNAAEIAQIVRDVYSSRLASSPGQQRQPSPEEFIRALRGGGGQGNSNNERTAEEQSKLTVGVDARRNALIVAAQDVLFEEIKVLVGQLDQVDPNVMEMTRVITLRKADPELVRQALATLVGDSSRDAAANAATPAGSPSVGREQPAASAPRETGGDRPGNDFNEIRRRIEFMRALQQQSDGGGKSQNKQPARGPRPGR